MASGFTLRRSSAAAAVRALDGERRGEGGEDGAFHGASLRWGGGPQPRASAARIAPPRPIRYQANGVKPRRWMKSSDHLTTNSAERKAASDPRRSAWRCRGEDRPVLVEIVGEGPGHGRDGEKERELRPPPAAPPQQQRADDGRAERLTPAPWRGTGSPRSSGRPTAAGASEAAYLTRGRFGARPR